jgi:uncharacterized membrane protein
LGELLAALLAFVLSHLLPMHPPWRRALEARFGARGFLLGYSLLSLLLLTWLVSAYFDTPYLLLWSWSPWAAWLPVLIMPIACVLLVAGLTSPNPFSLGLGAKNYDPKRPGIVSVTRHPLMWALALWSGAHIPVNGDLAAVVLFGLMLLLSLSGTLSIERNRRSRFVEQKAWRRLYAGTCNLPRLAGIDWRGIGLLRVLAGMLLYLTLISLHQSLIGQPPLLRGLYLL